MADTKPRRLVESLFLGIVKRNTHSPDEQALVEMLWDYLTNEQKQALQGIGYELS